MIPLLRWQPTSGWSFETLGLAGRDDHVSTELNAWRRLLRDAVANALPPVSAARFTTVDPPASTRLRYLASIDAAIGRIHAGEFYQLNLCTRLVSSSADGAALLFAHLASKLDPPYGGLLITTARRRTRRRANRGRGQHQPRTVPPRAWLDGDQLNRSRAQPRGLPEMLTPPCFVPPRRTRPRTS